MAGPERHKPDGWGWFEQQQGAQSPAEAGPDVCHAFRACLGGPHGEQAMAHLRRVFLDRRVPPSAPNAELRHVEGQRSVVAYIAALIERAGRDRHEDRV